MSNTSSITLDDANVFIRFVNSVNGKRIRLYTQDDHIRDHIRRKQSNSFTESSTTEYISKLRSSTRLTSSTVPIRQSQNVEMPMTLPMRIDLRERRLKHPSRFSDDEN